MHFRRTSSTNSTYLAYLSFFFYRVVLVSPAWSSLCVAGAKGQHIPPTASSLEGSRVKNLYQDPTSQLPSFSQPVRDLPSLRFALRSESSAPSPFLRDAA